MELNKIHNNDCLSNLCLIEDATIDLVILDPDYNDWDMLSKKGLINEAVRVLKPTGNIICFTKQPFDYNLRNEINFMFRREIIWSFCNGGAWVSNKMPLVSFQKLYGVHQIRKISSLIQEQVCHTMRTHPIKRNENQRFLKGITKRVGNL